MQLPGEHEGQSFQGQAASFLHLPGPHARLFQLIQDLAVFLILEEVVQALGDLRADLLDLFQFFLPGVFQLLQAAEVEGQHLGHVLPHVADSQGVEKAVQERLFCPLDGPVQLGRRFLGESLQALQLLLFELVQVGQLPDQSLFHELFDVLLPQGLYVQGVTGGVMDDPADPLGRTCQPCRAEYVGSLPDYGAAAGWAPGGHGKPLAPFLPGLLDPLGHLGDHVSGPEDPHRISRTYVLAFHLLFVVQGGPADRDASHLHGIEQGHRGEHARASHLHGDVPQRGDLLFRREFPGEGPAGAALAGAQLLPRSPVVELDHHSVDLVGKILPLAQKLLPVPFDLLVPRGAAVQGIRLEAPAGKQRQNFPV